MSFAWMRAARTTAIRSFILREMCACCCAASQMPTEPFCSMTDSCTRDRVPASAATSAGEQQHAAAACAHERTGSGRQPRAFARPPEVEGIAEEAHRQDEHAEHQRRRVDRIGVEVASQKDGDHDDDEGHRPLEGERLKEPWPRRARPQPSRAFHGRVARAARTRGAPRERLGSATAIGGMARSMHGGQRLEVDVLAQVQRVRRTQDAAAPRDLRARRRSEKYGRHDHLGAKARRKAQRNVGRREARARAARGMLQPDANQLHDAAEGEGDSVRPPDALRVEDNPHRH
eukprot:2281834-Prymnesium_polylepis.1